MLFDGRSLTVSADIQFMAVFAGFSSGRRSIMSSELHTVSLFSQYLIAAPTLTFPVLHQKALVFEYSLLICLVRSLYYTDTWLELTLGQWLCKFVCNLSCVMCYDTVRASWWETVSSTDGWSGPGNVSRHVSREGALHAWGPASTQCLWDAPWNWPGMSLLSEPPLSLWLEMKLKDSVRASD